MIKCWRRILEEARKLEEQGFRVIPITNVIPDIIAIKNGKVFAVEVEYGSCPDYTKYDDTRYRQFFDDVMWIIRSPYGGAK
jgi:hypothetical protein